MSAEGADSLNPSTWIARAESNLHLARLGFGVEGILLEDLCFDLQQAAEKAFKAVLVSRSVEFPKTHSIARLIGLLRDSGAVVPPCLEPAICLNPYAVRTRYPGGPPITEQDYHAALAIAVLVVAWARTQVDE